ncbi:MAG: alpha-galactosidase [Clostridiales bacterium]|nr:alpha-galactosidase [Clostridiales bacterium]
MTAVNLGAPGRRGILFAPRGAGMAPERFFGLICSAGGMPECGGSFYLSTDKGRFEDRRIVPEGFTHDGEELRMTFLTSGGEYRLETVWRLDAGTGIVTRDDSLTNLGDEPSVIYACLPRIALSGDGYEIYGQASNWSAENQGSWRDLCAGSVTLSNSSGRSCDSCTPFAFIRHKQSRLAAAIHVRPVGDWIIRAGRISDGRASKTVIEAGLSDRDLHMTVAAGETIELPRLIFCGFEGEAERGSGDLQRYLIREYALDRLPPLVYNTWFYRFDILEPEELKEQAARAKELGCRVFVVDAGWFGAGEDWANQVGNWQECSERAFRGGMREFADYVRSIGMGFGLWMEPERACPGTPVYEEHPGWFLDEDAVVYDLTNPKVREHLCSELTRLVETYGLCWMKLDFNSNMLRDRTGSNYYRYFRAEEILMRMIRERNPGCTFEGCSSGGMRSDFHTCLSFYHGFFISDTVNPLECLRIRQGASLRALPSYLGAWTVIHETGFGIGSYFDRDRANRTKTLAAADPWWQRTVDVSADFAVKTALMGEWGLSGDLSSYGPGTAAAVKAGAAFYEEHREFLARSVFHPLTGIQSLNDFTGWTAAQYENADGKGSLIFVFRLIDDTEEYAVFPRNIDPDARYLVSADGEVSEMSGWEINSIGVKVSCGARFGGVIVSIEPKA